MICEETVFILGAGASCPYGYPTGEGLRKQIIDEYHSWSKLLNYSGVSPSEKFIKAFDSSGTQSIDLFLSRNPEFSAIGKVAIVKCISDCEKKSKSQKKTIITMDNWYSYLFHEMTKDFSRKKDFEKISDNKISFITFNYDRSFEYFLAESLNNSFLVDDKEKIIEVLKKIKIFHVYGQLAPLRWQEELNGRDYGYIADSEIKELAKNIFVIGEERQQIDTILKQQIIQKAKKIFFLGFGFRKENLDRLGLPKSFTEEHKVFGSGVNMFKEEIINLRRDFTGGAVFSSACPKRNIKGFPCPDQVVIEVKADCTTILRKYLSLKDENYLSHLCIESKGYHS